MRLATCLVLGQVFSACAGEATSDMVGGAGPGEPSGSAGAGMAGPGGGSAGAAAAGSAAMAAAGTGAASAPTGGVAPGDGTSGMDCSAADVAPSVLHRLTQLEYQLSLKELFRLPAAPDVAGIPEDSTYNGFRTLSEIHGVTTEHLRGYHDLAAGLMQSLIEDSSRLEQVVGCEVGAAGCLETFVRDFGELAYRRPLDAGEVSALVASAEAVATGGAEQLVFVSQALLSSPSFLYRVEVGEQNADLSTLTGLELASRLSFALIGRGPSRELMNRGIAGELDTAEGLREVAAELLADARASEFFDAFFKQWLQFEKLRVPPEPPAGWDDSLLGMMTQETEALLGEYAWSPGMNFLDVLTTEHTFLTPELAEFYGLPAPGADGRVDIPAGHDRAGSGVLTHAALISAKGDGDSVAHRGKWIQGSLLCRDLEIPAALLDALSDELEGLTYQQMLDARNSRAECKGCHALIDPIGVGFSQYDDVGSFDASLATRRFGIEPGLPNSDGTAGGSFESIGELSALLRARAEVASCLTERAFLYTAGRVPQAADECAVQKAGERFAGQQYQFASLLEGLVFAPEFRLRRAPTPVAE